MTMRLSRRRNRSHTNLSLEALHTAAARLPRIAWQGLVSRSQVIFCRGHIGLIEGIIGRIRPEREAWMKMVAIDGLAPLLAERAGVAATSRSRSYIGGASAVGGSQPGPHFSENLPMQFRPEQAPYRGGARLWNAQGMKGWGEVCTTMP
jgi:hypothetical protein